MKKYFYTKTCFIGVKVLLYDSNIIYRQFTQYLIRSCKAGHKQSCGCLNAFCYFPPPKIYTRNTTTPRKPKNW